jgi:hypothetical protein
MRSMVGGALREAESRSIVAAQSEGGEVDVDNSNTTITKSLRKRMVAARFEAEVEVAACS